MSDDNAVTPNRRTRFQVGVNEKCFLSPPWKYHLPGRYIARYLSRGAPISQNVWLLPGNTWGLRPHTADPSRLLHPAYTNSILGASNFNAAPAMTSVQTTPQTTGFGGGSLSPATHWQKEIADPSNPYSELTADVAAVPKPPTTSRVALTDDPSGIYDNQVPIDRVLAGTYTCGPNQPFSLLISAPNGHFNSDTFFRFYFGGVTPTYPLGTRGGEFSLNLRGDGEAELWERDFTTATGWGLRKIFRWAEPGRANQSTHSLQIIPHSRSRIAFRNHALGVTAPRAPVSLEATTPGFASPGGNDDDLYIELDSESVHTHIESMTGPGVVRADIRRDHQDLFLAARMDYPPRGLLVTDLFTVNRIPAAGEIVFITGDWHIPAGTAIHFTAYATDGTPCTGLTNGFLTQAGKQTYYLIFEFLTTVPSQTPVLHSLDLAMDPVEQEIEVTSETGGLVQSVWVNQGTPDQEIALLHIEDPDADLPTLQDRGGSRCRILLDNTSISPAPVKSVLFEGRAVDVRAHMVQGAGGFGWPTASWKNFPNVRLLGLFSWLAQHPLAEPVNYGNSGNAGLPWLVVDAIRDVFIRAGVTDAELDIPFNALRLPIDALGEGSPLSMQSQFASDPTVLISYLVRDVLGADWVRCFNSGLLLPDGTPRGMWRVLPPTDYTNPLATFYTETPASVTGKDLVDLGSYPANSCWVEEYSEYWTQAENNAVVITGVAGTGQSARRIVTRLRNVPGLSNPSHADFIPGFKEYVAPVDPTLTTQDACDRRARIEYRRRCHGLQRFECRAPLLLITDTNDTHQRLPRPLRKNDAVIVSDGVVGRPAVIENCVFDWDRDGGGDAFQYCQIEGRFRVNLTDGEVF